MNMKTIKTMKSSLLFSISALVAAAFSGCASDEATLSRQSAGQGDVVPVTATVQTSPLASTRGADGLNDNTSGFSLLTGTNSDSKVHVRVQNGSGGYGDFAYTITGSTAITPPATPPYFPAGMNSVSVYGWYPDNGGSTTFTVQDNQQSDANYCLSDVMVAQPTTSTRALTGSPATWSVTPAALSFQHIMAKMKVVLAPVSGVTITQVKIKNVKKQVTLETTGSPVVTAISATTDGTPGDITLVSGASITSASTTTQKTLCGVFPAQTITAGTGVLEITASYGGSSNTITLKVDADKAFAGNNEYVVNATVSLINADQSVTVTGWAAAGNSPVNIEVGSKVDFGELNVQTSGSFSYAVGATNPYPSVLSVTYTRYGTTTPDPTTLTNGTDYDVVYYTSDGSTTIDKGSISAAGTYYMAVVGKGSYLGAKWMKAFTLANAVSGTPAVGSYLYADGFCSTSATTTGHGAVVGVIFSLTTSNADQALGYTHGYAVALKDASTSAKWSSQTSLADPGVVDLSFPYQNTMAQAELIIRGDLNGRANTANATYVGTTNAEAFYAAKNYSADVSGFANSGWFLPSIGQLWAMCKELGGMNESQIGNSTYSNWGSEDRTYGVWYGSNNADNVREALNTKLEAVGSGNYDYFSGGANVGKGNASAQNVGYWSSSEWSAGYAFYLGFGNGGNLYFTRVIAKSNSFRVRPVLAF